MKTIKLKKLKTMNVLSFLRPVMVAALILAACTGNKASAQVTITSGTTGGCTWTLTCTSSNTDTTLTISKTASGDGAMADYTSSSTPPWNSYRAKITHLVINSGVTKIGNYAFYQYAALTGSLTIPSGVTSIGTSAFENCSGLTSLTIPSSVTSIGNYTFYNCSGLTGSLTIPSSVTSIGSSAFYGCTGLTGTLTIPSSLTSIGSNVFYNCSGFTGSLTIPSSVTSIGTYAFYGCSSLTGSLTIPSSVTSIGTYAFAYCSGLTGSLTIPSSLTSIGENAFAYCSGLTGSLTIPASVTSIGIAAFYGCSGFTGSLTIPSSVTTIEQYTFYGCTGLTSVTIPSSVVAIASNAFANCTGLTSITAQRTTPPNTDATSFSGVPTGIPVTVPCGTIPTYQAATGWTAFTNIQESPAVIASGTTGGCDWVLTQACNNTDTTLTISKTSGGSGAMEDYADGSAMPWNSYKANIKYLVIEDGVTTIGNYAFYYCGSLTGTLTIPSTVTSIGNYAFQNCSGLTGSLTIPSSVTSISNGAFYNCTGFNGTLTIPSSVASIGYAAFANCSGLTGTLTIPSSLTSIQTSTFYGCSGLTGTLTIPSSVTSIGNGAFYGCTGFSGSLTIPSAVTSIGLQTFNGCTGFNGTLTIPASVTSIGTAAFNGCTALTAITAQGTTPPTTDATSFYAVPTSIPVNVPCGTAAAYKAATGWTDFTNVIDPAVIASGTSGGCDWVLTQACNNTDTTLTISKSASGNGAMDDYSIPSIPWYSYLADIKYLVIEDGVTHIGGRAFFNCSGLTGSLTIPSSVTSIGDWAFYNCSGLTGTLTIPSSVTSMTGYTFYNCSGFTSVTIPSSITSIEQYTFKGCTGLTNLTLPSSVTSISTQAFYNCSGLTSITAQSTTPPTTDATSFTNVPTAIPVNVPCGTVAAYQAATGWTGFTNITDAAVIASGTSGGCTWTLTENCTNDTTLTISKTSGGSGAMADYADNTSMPWYSYLADIKYLVIEDGVTSIGNNAFHTHSALTGSLTLPSSLTSIGNSAFTSCHGLTGSLTIPSSVTSIGSYAFMACTGLTGTLTLPSSVTSIGSYAFYQCSGLTGTLTIPASLTSIGDYTFMGCSGFTGTLTIPSAVTSIGDFAFSNCTGFTGSLTIPSAVTSIGTYTFANCHSFNGSLTLPSSLTSIGENAFGNCTGLTSITAQRTTPPTTDATSFTNVSTGIPVYVPCSSVSTYQAATGWTGFTNIIGTSVIDGGTTGGCTWTLTENCANDTTLTISKTSGGTGIMPDYANNNAMPWNAYKANIKYLVIEDGVTKIGQYAFYQHTALTGSLTIPSTVTSIGTYAFANCSGLTGTLTIPSAVTSIGEGAFSGCSGFTGTLIIPYGVTTIGTNTFYNCTGFTGSLTIPSSVTSIGYYAFEGCSGLTGMLTIPSSVTTINTEAFYGCTGLTSITAKGTTPPTTDASSFTNVPTGIPVYVPCSSVSTYQAATGWTGFTNIIGTSVIASGTLGGCDWVVTENCSSNTDTTLTISKSASGNGAMGDVGALNTQPWYSYQTKIKYLVIEDGVTRIGNNAFHGCSGFTGTLNIPNSVTTIVTYAFHSCSGFTGTLTIPSSVTSISGYAFYGCSGFTDVIIPSSITSIEQYTFRGCSGLTSVTIPSSVASIGSYAFLNCTGLTSITAQRTTPPTAYANSSFNGVPTAIPVYVPCGTVAAYQAATGWTAFTNIVEPAITIVSGTTGGCDWTLTETCAHTDTTLTISRSASGDGAMLDYVGGTGMPWYSYLADIKYLVIEDGVTTVGNYAFYGCSGLTGTLTIPSSVTSIGTNAFNGCTGLTSITAQRTTPPTTDATSFTNVSTSIPVYVPCGSHEAYYNTGTSLWAAFENLQTITKDVIADTNYIYTYRGVAFSQTTSTHGTTTYSVSNPTSAGLYVWNDTICGDSTGCDKIRTNRLLVRDSVVVHNGEFYIENSNNWGSFDETDSLTPAGNGYALIIEDGGQYFNNTANTKTATVEKNLPFAKWAFIGSPIGETTFKWFSNDDLYLDSLHILMYKNPAENYIVGYKFNYANNDWSSPHSYRDDTIYRGQGIFVWNGGADSQFGTGSSIDTRANFHGELVNEDFTFTQSFTATTNEWVSLANPYSFNIYPKIFIANNAGKVQGNVVYLYNNALDDWNNVNSTDNTEVHVGEGFMIAVPDGTTDATLDFMVNMKDSVDVLEKGSKAKSTADNSIILSVYANNLTKAATLVLNDEASNGFDILDAYSLFGNNDAIVYPSFSVEGRDLVINSIKTIPYIVPLNLLSYHSNAVEISAVSDMDSEITLIDLTDHTETSLKNGNTYVANVNEGNNAGRFVLKVGSDAGLNQATGEETSLDIWTDGNTLTVVGDNLTEVTIYNVLGQEVYTKKLSGNYFSTTLTLESGYYVVKAKSSTKNKTYSLIH